jgi:hypothetical protein
MNPHDKIFGIIWVDNSNGLKGRYNLAQGNALGLRDYPNIIRPERAG